MSSAKSIELRGRRGRIVVHRWSANEPKFVALIAHGIGEHAGRYAHVAARLVAEGATVYAPDFQGHGLSEGERARFETIDDLVDELASVYEAARKAHPELPVVLVGHSLGGLTSTRFVQRDQPELAALVLSGPVVGGNPQFEALLTMDPLPDVPIDPRILSRDPAVGEAYAADALIYHGPLHRGTLEAIFAGARKVQEGPNFGDLPTLWIHGEGDVLAPLDVSTTAMNRIRGTRIEEHVYPGAQHEVLNEINKDEVLNDVVGFLRGALRAQRQASTP
ncbi:MAG: lysophospholipase [Chloroflexi bacterium]|nr:MAG: lysophospholipase [Chloroflexota bacterium]